ncbi:MAG TPA: hypothetical protein VFS66_05645, partial [Acidimicrobiia bacterium]|nr:hypothetical protein [Acidimicrobiia bacterium]
RLDISVDSAKTLVRTMRRLQDRPDLQGLLAEGSVSFDRVEALSRIPEDVGLMEWADVAGVRREASHRVRVTAEDEYRSARDQFMVMQPNLDESWWRFWGGLDGPSGSLMDKVLSEAADQLPDLPDDMATDAGWKRAMALVETLTSDEPPPANVTVIVDSRHATGTNGKAGVYLEAGPNVGREALQGILCDADTQVLARSEDGRFMDYGRRQRTAPPALKRALIHAAHGQCQADGCTSRRRLQIHHLVPWVEGGETNQTGLVVLCWFHHQVVVHQRGFRIYFHHERRVRFRRPGHPPDRQRPS